MKSLYKKLKPYILLSISLITSGCATSYLGPAQSEPHATLHMVMDIPHATAVGWRYFKTGSCVDKLRESLGDYSRLYEHDKKILLKANETRVLYVNSMTNSLAAPYACGGPTCIQSNYCQRAFEITPVADKSYLASYAGSGSDCTLNITEENSTVRVPEVKEIPVPPLCP